MSEGDRGVLLDTGAAYLLDYLIKEVVSCRHPDPVKEMLRILSNGEFRLSPEQLERFTTDVKDLQVLQYALKESEPSTQTELSSHIEDSCYNIARLLIAAHRNQLISQTHQSEEDNPSGEPSFKLPSNVVVDSNLMRFSTSLAYSAIKMQSKYVLSRISKIYCIIENTPEVPVTEATLASYSSQKKWLFGDNKEIKITLQVVVRSSSEQNRLREILREGGGGQSITVELIGEQDCTLKCVQHLLTKIDKRRDSISCEPYLVILRSQIPMYFSQLGGIIYEMIQKQTCIGLLYEKGFFVQNPSETIFSQLLRRLISSPWIDQCGIGHAPISCFRLQALQAACSGHDCVMWGNASVELFLRIHMSTSERNPTSSNSTSSEKRKVPNIVSHFVVPAATVIGDFLRPQVDVSYCYWSALAASVIPKGSSKKIDPPKNFAPYLNEQLFNSLIETVGRERVDPFPGTALPIPLCTSDVKPSKAKRGLKTF